MDMRRAYVEGLEVRQVGEGRREIAGVAIRYNSVTQPVLSWPDFREQFLPGSFTESLANPVRDITANWNHDRTFQLGSMAAGTLRFTDTPDALEFRVAVFPQFDWVVDLVASGEARGASVEFMPQDMRRDMVDGNAVESVERAMLRGVGVVNAPAYLDAQVDIARAFCDSLDTERFMDEADGVPEEEDDPMDLRRQQETRLAIQELLA